MKKPIFVEIDETFALRRSTIISIRIVNVSYSTKECVLVSYVENKETREYETKGYDIISCENEYKRILEALK